MKIISVNYRARLVRHLAFSKSFCSVKKKSEIIIPDPISLKPISSNQLLLIHFVITLLSRNFCHSMPRTRSFFRQFNLHTLWKLREFSLTEKKFREINFLVTYLVKPLLSRNFCQKCVRKNSRNFQLFGKKS